MGNVIFDKERFLELDDSNATSKANAIKANFNEKKGFYSKLGETPAAITFWLDYKETFTLFSSEFSALERDWHSALNSKNKHVLADYFEKVSNLFGAFQIYLEDKMPNETRSGDIEKIKQEVLLDFEEKSKKVSEKIESSINELSSHLKERVDAGIRDILDLKSELGLAKNFGSQISSELESSGRQKRIFFSLFVATLLCIPLLVFLSSYLESMLNIASINGGIIKFSISISMLFLSYFFFSQYKIYQMINLRYIHLMGFIGGGATFIAQLIESENEELKIEINRKLAHLFMGLDDILGLIRRNKHPSEASLEKITNVLDKINLK